MPKYVAKIVSSEFMCNALDENDAEEKYAAWFNNEPCNCESQGLPCVCSFDDNCVDHLWEVEDAELV